MGCDLIKLLQCGHNNWSDFTTSWDESSHQFCHTCKGHFYNGKMWSKQEWDISMSLKDFSKIEKIYAGKKCNNCTYYEPYLIGGYCHGPELECGELDNGDGICEQWMPK